MNQELKDKLKKCCPSFLLEGRRFLYWWYKKLNTPELKKELEKISKKTDNLFFIKIGAHDGTTWDNTYPFIVSHACSGILVEPVREAFDKLVENHKGQAGIFFENVAISDKNEMRDFYRIKKSPGEDMPCWCDQLGSFFPEVVLEEEKHFPGLHNHLICEKVRCITFADLIRKYNIERVDLLFIDTEGYDYEIIKQIDFKKIKPKLILFEHLHLTPQDREACESLLAEHGYRIVRSDWDTFCILNSRTA